MPPTRRRFGPLTYGTLALAVIVVAGVVGEKTVWPLVTPWLEAREQAAILRGTSPGPADRAAERLAKLGTPGFRELVKAANDPLNNVRALAVEQVALSRERSAAVVPILLEASVDPSPPVRLWASVGLANHLQNRDPRISTDQRRAMLVALRQSLTDPNFLVRHESVRSPPRLQGDESSALLPTLRDRLDDPAINVRIAAAQALLWIDPASTPVVVDHLVAWLDERQQYSLHIQAAMTAANTSREAADRVVAVVLAHARLESPNGNYAWIRILGYLASKTPEADAGLQAFALDADPTVRFVTAETLLLHRPSDPEAVRILIGVLADPEAPLPLRMEALRLVQRHQPNAETEAILPLVDAMLYGSPQVEDEAWQLLWHIIPNWRLGLVPGVPASLTPPPLVPTPTAETTPTTGKID